MSVNSTRKSTIEYPFKKEHVLDNKHETLENKIKALITTWGELGSLRTIPSPENMQTLTEFLKSHTLNLVLSASWLRYKDKYYNELMNSISKCKKVFGSFRGFQLLCIKLVTIADCPWKKKTINRYLNSSDIAIDIQDYNFFVHEESAYFISMRLKKLCDEGCEDIALNLTRAYLKCCEWAEIHDKPMYISDAQKKFVFDAYLALLYKFNHIGEMSQLLKAASLSEGVDMVRRFATKQISVSKLWVNTISIAHLSGTIFITRGVLMPLDQECAICLNELLNVWLPTYEFETEKDELIACLRRIMKNAKTAPHMYTISNNLSKKYGVTMRTYNVEIYIQALNTDLNLLERLKQEEQEDKVDEVTGRIADGLWDLSNLLIDNISVSKECILTAFSLKPTERCFKRIEEFARLSGKDVLDTGQWICKFHPAPTENDDLLIICDKCGDFMAELKITAITRPNISLTEALQNNNMGLSPQLCDDLVVIIFCARYQLLNWLQNWSDLHRLCIMYLNDPVSTKNLITELKFLEIDYTPFLVKRELESLEQYDTQIDQVISDEYQDTKKKRKRKRILSTDEEDEDEEEEEEEEEEVANPEEDYLAHCQKSDPEVLKTLRSFRRTLKPFEPEPTDHFNRMPVQMPIPPWHEVALDYSGSNTDGAQSSSSSYSPLNEPVLHNPEIAGIQIRKDIYNDPSDHFKALEFFRATNPNVDVLRYNLDERNFHNPPVIQVNQSLSLDTKNEVAYNKAASCSNNCNVLIKRTDQSLNSGEDLKYRVNNNSKISNSKQAILEQNDLKTTFARNGRGAGLLESGRNMVPIQEMYYSYFNKHRANNNDIDPFVKPFMPEKGDQASLERTTELRNLKNQSNSQNTKEKVVLLETTKNLTSLESAGEGNEICFEEKVAEGIENMELTDIELVSINNLPTSTVPIDDNVFEEMEELFMTKDAKVPSVENNDTIVTPTEELHIPEQQVPVAVVKDSGVQHFEEDMEVSYSKEVTVTTETDMLWMSPHTETKEADEQSNIVNMEQNVNNFDIDVDEEKDLSAEENSKIYDTHCMFDKEKEADADVKESELSDTDTEVFSLLTNSDYTKVEFDLEVTPIPKDIVSPCKVVLEKLKYEENSTIKEKSHLNDLKEKFKMKECSVILNRLQDSVIKKQLHKDRANKKRGRGRPRKTKIKLDELTLSENNLTSDKSSNGNYNCFTLPLQSKNQQVSIISNKSKCILEDLKRKLLVSSDKMNPRVILKRLDDSCIKSLLARVPGISDTNLFRPENTDQIVNVVQVAGGRATSTVQAPNTQTSTQVSPHIQRIGQPRNEKSEQVPTSETSSSSISKSSNSYTVTKPVSTQSPTLINILSQQIIRPSNSNNTRRAGPLINILSQQTIRPASTSVATKTSTTVTGETQGNSRIIATSTDQQQIINQIVNPGRTTGSLKTVVDGKLIPVTSFPTNRLVKVGTTQAASDSPNVEETYTKMAPSKKTDSAEISETLPKFQQAFGENVKVEERVQSVLVTAGSSNGPMLAHSPPQYKQSDCNSNNEQTKDDYLRNGGKRNEKVQQNSSFCIQGKAKKNSSSGRIEREVQQICMQRRQAAIERELRLQKSLSEECEDLGVDEPSTSDLFPEALLYDANNSPSFDQTSHDLLKRSAQTQDKEENKLTLFSDDDFMFETNQYQTHDNQLCYEEVVDSRMMTNGQNSTNCEDNTLLQTCTSMSDVTLCSPISPDTYNSTTPPPLNKYMHKYINKKKNDRIKHVDNWTTEVSSSEDTTGSNELGKRSTSPDTCLNKRSDEETDGSFKVVRLSISKSNCSDMHCTDSTDCSISGRGARKSVKKKCSCCNGSEDSMLQRKRPSSQQHTNNPHKKAFLTKKR